MDGPVVLLHAGRRALYQFNAHIADPAPTSYLHLFYSADQSCVDVLGLRHCAAGRDYECGVVLCFGGGAECCVDDVGAFTVGASRSDHGLVLRKLGKGRGFCFLCSQRMTYPCRGTRISL